MRVYPAAAGVEKAGFVPASFLKPAPVDGSKASALAGTSAAGPPISSVGKHGSKAAAAHAPKAKVSLGSSSSDATLAFAPMALDVTNVAAVTQVEAEAYQMEAEAMGSFASSFAIAEEAALSVARGVGARRSPLPCRPRSPPRHHACFSAEPSRMPINSVGGVVPVSTGFTAVPIATAAFTAPALALALAPTSALDDALAEQLPTVLLAAPPSATTSNISSDHDAFRLIAEARPVLLAAPPLATTSNISAHQEAFRLIAEAHQKNASNVSIARSAHPAL